MNFKAIIAAASCLIATSTHAQYVAEFRGSPGYNRENLARVASDNAKNRAVSNCRRDGYTPVTRQDNADVTVSCRAVTSGYGEWQCTARASIGCFEY
jgi:hypothetical protein